MTKEESIQWFEETKLGGKLLCDQTVVEASQIAIDAIRTVDALAAALSRCADICELCAHYKALPLDDCEDADCNCEICKANCGCAGCEDGSKFEFRKEE